MIKISIFSFVAVLIWAMKLLENQLVSHRVDQPCDCLMKYSAIQLLLAKTGNVEMVHFVN